MKNFCIAFVVLLFVLCAINLLFNINNRRYEIIMHPTYRADQYLLDTKTGKVWHLVEDKDKTLVWEPMFKLIPNNVENETNK